MLLEVDDLSVRFAVERGLLKRRSGWVHAVDAVSLRVAAGETLALVGESGSGKTTVGRAILRLLPASSGRVRIAGDDWTALEGEALRRARWRAQMVFQDPAGSLSPRRTVAEIVEGPMRLHGRAPAGGLRALLERVGLGPELASRAPSALSGGQRQRVAIARALATSPELVILDEALSALDASIAAQILNLLAALRADSGLSYLFIAHDLAAVRWLADRIAVMYLGRIVESAQRSALFAQPAHPYTRALLASVPSLTAPRLPVVLPGEPPSPLDPPSGCAFHPRCPVGRERVRCREEVPVLREIAMVPGTSLVREAPRTAACHYAEDVIASGTP